MQIQPAPAPLANGGATQVAVTPEAPPAAKSESARPVETVHKDPAPRFPYPETDRGLKIDIEA